jgi:hypothetical protein
VTPRDNEALIEACVTAYRARNAEGGIVAPPDWWDLPPESLDEVHRRQIEARELERMIDPRGESATVKAVRARILASHRPRP